MRTFRLPSVIAAWVAMAIALPAQQKPNFNGTWVAVAPASMAGQQRIVKQDATTLSMRHAAEGDDHVLEYPLDGTERRTTMSSHGSAIVTVSRATWSGNRLTLTSTSTYPDGRKLEQHQEWALDDEGRLVIQMTQTMQGGEPVKETMVFRKR